MLPRVILHNAISLDGRMNGFPADLGQFYELAARWKEDATMAGADTILKAAENVCPQRMRGSYSRPRMIPLTLRPLLVIPDSHGRVRIWHYLKTLPYWRGFIALCSHSTPQDCLDYLKERHVYCIKAGEDHVDMRAALEALNHRYGVRVVRADCGGTLNGVLLSQRLVNEVSVLVHPSLVGGTGQSSLFRSLDPASPEGSIHLRLTYLDRLGGDVVWRRYEMLQIGDLEQNREIKSVFLVVSGCTSQRANNRPISLQDFYLGAGRLPGGSPKTAFLSASWLIMNLIAPRVSTLNPRPKSPQN